MTEPKVIYATIRDGVDELHIECRMSDGQKGAFVKVDAEFPELAERLCAAIVDPLWLKAVDKAANEATHDSEIADRAMVYYRELTRSIAAKDES